MLAGFTHASGRRALGAARARSRRRRSATRSTARDGASAIEIALKMSFHYWRNRGRPRQERASSSLAERLPRRDARRAVGHRRRAVPRHLRAAAARERARCRRPDWRLRGAGEIAARRAPSARARALEAHLDEHHATTAALIVEPLVQGAAGMAMHDAALPAPRARAVHALRRAPDRRRDHDRLRPHRDDVRVRAGRHRARLPAACRRASPAATCRCRAC